MTDTRQAAERDLALAYAGGLRLGRITIVRRLQAALDAFVLDSSDLNRDRLAALLDDLADHDEHRRSIARARALAAMREGYECVCDAYDRL